MRWAIACRTVPASKRATLQQTYKQTNKQTNIFIHTSASRNNTRAQKNNSAYQLSPVRPLPGPSQAVAAAAAVVRRPSHQTFRPWDSWMRPRPSSTDQTAVPVSRYECECDSGRREREREWRCSGEGNQDESRETVGEGRGGESRNRTIVSRSVAIACCICNMA